MIALRFDAPRPRDAALARGWEAEQQVAHDLGRAFAETPASNPVLLFHGLRFRVVRSASDNDHAQIDHLVLHRHGMVIVECKATGDGTGEFHIDKADQWSRSPNGRQRFNIESPVIQAKKQAEALRALLQSAEPPLLGKLAGLVQKVFREFPILSLVAIANTARVTGPGAARYDGVVMKSEKIVERIRSEIELHRRASGFIGVLRSTEADRGVFSLSEEEMDRICRFLLARHTPLNPTVQAPPAPPAVPARPTATAVAPATPASQPVSAPKALPPPPRQSTEQTASTGRKASLEPLTCRHCRSINVSPVYRRDYCLLCDECGKYTPIDRACPKCGKAATVRKRGEEFFRACEKERGGCGAELVFWSGEG